MKRQKIVRRPDFAGGGITSEERKEMDAYSKLWIDRAFRTEPIEQDKITDAIKGLYRAANLKEPRVVIVSSPMVMAFAYGAAAAIWYDRKNNTRAATDAATDAATYAATRAATYAATDAATYAATDAATDAARRACYNLAGNLGICCARLWWRSYQGGNMWAWIPAFIGAARDVLGLQLDAHGRYAHWEQASTQGGFRVMHEEFCIVSDFPEYFNRDEDGLLHCANGPSIRWRDGFSTYHWRGQEIPGEWIEDPSTLTPEVALTWRNVEQRRAAAEILGWEKILAELDAETIDEDGDPEIGTLVEVSIPEIGRERFLRVRCGTGRLFALPVPPDMKTALEAQAWTWGLEADDFIKPTMRT